MHSPAVSTKEIGGGSILKVLSIQLEKILRHFSRSSHVCPSHLCLALIVKVVLETKWSWFGITFWATLAMIIVPLFLLSPFFWSLLPQFMQPWKYCQTRYPALPRGSTEPRQGPAPPLLEKMALWSRQRWSSEPLCTLRSASPPLFPKFF